jgi:hypothetical protein
MIDVSEKLYEVVKQAFKSKIWRWRLEDLDAPRGMGGLDDEWCDHLRDDLGVIIEYCDWRLSAPGDILQDYNKILMGKGSSFHDEVVCKKSKKKSHDQFLACLNPRNPDPENYYSVLIFPRELAEKVLVLGHLP